MSLTIRPATAEDEALWRGLWSQYLAFYNVDLAPEVTARTWARVVDPTAPLCGMLAFDGDQLLGFALHHTHCSTWVLGEDRYLEDLFVAPEARGKGVGRALIDALIALCRAEGNARLYWHTDEGNSRARALYDSYAKSDGHIRYRLKL